MARSVRFVFHCPGARSVSLAGDFNNWDGAAQPMLYDPQADEWSLILPLLPGRHEYRYFVDGRVWWNDPKARTVPNVWGSENSYVDVEEETGAEPHGTAPLRRARRRRPARRAQTHRADEHLWAIVLAGGEGMRLRALTRHLFGEPRPKQYAALIGGRSLLRSTLDRTALTVAPERTVITTVRSHARYLARELDTASRPHVVVQPENLGTAAGILLPVHWISWRDPEATVAVFPSDHFVSDDQAFMRHVAEVSAFASRDPQWLVLIGARPTEPDPDYGWIEPGEPLGRTRGSPIWRVRRFWEKPSPDTARECLGRGGLWSTLIMVSKAATLLETGRQYLPEIHNRLARIAPFAGTPDEEWAIRQAYALTPKANFSRAVLERYHEVLAVSRLPAITWSDLGIPRRALRVLKKSRVLPPWLSASDLPA